MTTPKTKRPPAPPRSVRLLPAVMVTAAALLGVKAVAMAEDLAAAPANAAASSEAAIASTAHDGEGGAGQSPANGAAAQTQCTPSFADQAGLSQSEVQVLQALGARRQALDQRAVSMETQDQLMAAAEQRLNQRLAELHQLETTVNGLLGQLDEAQEHRLAGLVDVYQRMRAKDAATVFDGLEDATLLQVAGRMRQQNLAEVMGKMSPARARALTQMLADQARPPTDGQALLNQSQRAPGASR